MHEWHLCLFVHLTHYSKMNLKLLKAGAVIVVLIPELMLVPPVEAAFHAVAFAMIVI
jgi:hypothetical protein